MTVRIGKLQIVRLKGKDYDALRLACWERDLGKCRSCGLSTVFGLPHEWGISYHMAHIRTKRNNGDTLENVRTLCGDCHRAEHNPKVVPRKHLTTVY